MEVYYVRPLYNTAHSYQSSQTPPGLWIPNIRASSSSAAATTTMLRSLNVEAGGPGHLLTGGGLIRHGSAVYLITAPDMTMTGWRACAAARGGSGRHSRHGSSHTKRSSGSSSSGLSPSSQSSRSGGKKRASEAKSGSSSSSSSSDHSACQRRYESYCITRSHHQQQLAQSQAPQPEISGCLGHLVHFSVRYGFGLVLLDPAAMYLLDEHYGSSAGANPEAATCYGNAIPLEDFRRCIDKPQITDFIEFGTTGGEEVTGLVGSLVDYCCDPRSSRRSGSSSSSSSSSELMTTKMLVVQTASYAVAPADCGIWVRRSIASDNPLLLGHVVGSLDQGGQPGGSAGSSVFGGDLAESAEYEQYSYNTGFNSSAGGGGSADMLVLPFVGFADEIYRVVSSGKLNLL
ncbi:hypothetical protein Micbo1qcDRAFT_171024 [Microdochium bolleyi]|uniref:Uncharacterized protein n=1 Tax=Microdochium bolleyi TaxID=196109 RepID=A0A136JJL0_9PEZI|nr:hypothetical protein Micbo1qcDRAFT_171024 [Microdochium bolleyi]